MQHSNNGVQMLVILDPDDARPLYVQIVDEITRGIVVGSLRPEDPLPSVRELAAELVVNPRTVSQAYHELERAGALYVRRGQGTFVSPDVERDAAERRQTVAHQVAKRAVLDGRRHGMSDEDLVEAIRKLMDDESSEKLRSDDAGKRDVK